VSFAGMDGIRDHYVKWNKSNWVRQILHGFSCMQNVVLKISDMKVKQFYWR
jgi:hypothetical protein